ncbi:5'-nucleotidase, lipoprotein e(P4) family [Haliovirga abyssi]|uniref:5'-nucleotidase n=1 Tax=Haliovirga abyssi TaxID=2996794 RepID=A0AAU9DKA9_9FUSO|nr:5'-nucleotidase, lipoprotein e(P4) family [Haliovirga abyssi]BDU50322.1 5'-nucleotidase [Haliovirga abyssi]
MKKIGSFIAGILLSATVFAGTSEYVVQRGDTLSKIANKNKISVQKIMQFNNLKNMNFIREGQRLKLMPMYSQKNLNEQMVMAANWYQTSGEMQALSYQAFNMAKIIYYADLTSNKDNEQKRAVVVDIDETVLNNSPYDAGSIETNNSYPKEWNDWVKSEQAVPLPGAVEFLNFVVKNKGDVYYISNRSVKLLQPTINNLKKFGFPEADKEHVLLKGKTSNKEPRREQVAKNHRIVLLMGDNLNDFSYVFRGKTMSEKADLVDNLKSQFGNKFVLLPNPLYGDWEGDIYKGNWGMTPEQKNKARKEHLVKWE